MTEQAHLIEAVLAAPPERRDAILKAARGSDRPRPGTIREAADILGVHPRTVQRYRDNGLLHVVRLSPRCHRYDLAECERLATRGVPDGQE